MRQWYYVQEGQRVGPVSEPELAKLFESGQLAPGTLVWTSELKEWAAARDVEGLIPTADTAPPLPLSASSVEPNTLASQSEPSGEQVRPWVRYWARMLDFFLFSFLGGLVLAFVYEPALEMPDILFGILLLFAYALVEPAMLAGWGTTPGKALLRIRLRNSDGSKLSYADGLSRAFKVLIRGQGIGLPLVALFTQIYAYKRLTKQRITSWDEEGDFDVSHQVIGTGRIILTLLIFMAFAFLMILGEADI